MVEISESLEAELTNPRGRQLPAGVASLPLDSIDDLVQGPRVDVALVGGADERAEKLLAIEGLAVAVALDDLQALRDRPLVGGEAMAARRALTPAPDRVTLRGAAGLEGSGGGVATRTVHLVECS